jgi:hypothetical protein
VNITIFHEKNMLVHNFGLVVNVHILSALKELNCRFLYIFSDGKIVNMAKNDVKICEIVYYSQFCVIPFRAYKTQKLNPYSVVIKGYFINFFMMSD